MIIIGFKQLVNDFYAKDTGKKVRTGIRQKQKTGMTVNLPMGYYKDKKTGEVLVDETAAAIVREIFEKFFEGYRLSTIAKEFNRRGIKSPEYFLHRKVGAQRTQMCKKFDELSKNRSGELMSIAELLDEVLLEPYISDANMRLLVRKINVHENEERQP